MSKTTTAAKKIAEESNPVNFVQKLKKMPVTRRIVKVFDRFL